MVQKKTKRDAGKAGIDRDYSLVEWCQARRISRARFWKLREQGLAPDYVQLSRGGKITITREADAAWAKRVSGLRLAE